MKNFLKKHKKLIIILIIIALLVAAAWIYLSRKAQSSVTSVSSYTQVPVSRQSITKNLSGSGSLKVANSYSVSSRYSGEIIYAGFEEGDTVEEGQLLYIIDSSDDEEDEDDEKLRLTSTASGYISSVSVEVGDKVNMGQEIATVFNNSEMTLELNFSSADAKSFSVGDTATIVLDGSFEELTGTVEAIAYFDSLGDGNILQRTVTICVKNPGSLGINQLATATINGADCIEGAYFEYRTDTRVTAEYSGTVAKVYVKEGSSVVKGQTIVYLEASDDDSQIHEITSPISGTIVDKAYKLGENAESNATLCTIYDMSYLTMTLSVDELDIFSVAVGQEVIVTADATEGVEYEGTVTKVSVAGNSMGSTATYPVTIRIDEYGSLLPSMSADAMIVLEGVEDVLAVPNNAIQRGDTVMLTADSPTAVEAIANGTEADENGYVYVSVATGLSDDDYTEITSGLQEGDTVVYGRSGSSDEFSFDMMGGFGGGDMPSGGGGMPSGGGGGMPSGGGGGMPGGF